MSRRLPVWTLLLVIVPTLVAPVRVQAVTMYFWNFTFDSLVTGTSPTGSPPWAKLRVEDTLSPGEVLFTLQANLQNSNEFISRLWLNVNPYMVVMIKPGSVTGISSITLSQSGDEGEQDAGRKFDLKLDFPVSPPGNRLKNSMTVKWILQGSGLTASHFNALSGATGNNSPLYAMLHVQGISTQDDSGKVDSGKVDSGKVTTSLQPQGGVIPEPATLLLFGMGVAAPLGLLRRKR